MWLASLLLMVVQPTSARDWYWRPLDGAARGDGLSYATAWRGETSVEWQRMRPGDRVIFCGTHDAGYLDRRIVVGADGITLSGDCPGDPGRLIATGDRLDAADWKPAGPGFLQQPYGGSSSGYVLTAGLSTVPVVTREEIARTRCPAFAFDRSVGLAWYKPCADPETIYTSADDGIVIRNRHDVTVKRVAILNATRGVTVENSQRIDIEPDIRFAMMCAVTLLGRTRDGRIHDGEIRDAGNGICGLSDTHGSHDGWRVEGNRIYRIHGTDDAHGIGWQHGIDNIFRDNTITDVGGTGITLYVYRKGVMARNTIESNLIENVNYRPIPTNLGRGIEIGGDNCPGQAYGNRIRNNRLLNVPGPAMYLKSRPPPTGSFTAMVTGNVAENTGPILVRNIGARLKPPYATLDGNTNLAVDYAPHVSYCED